MTSRIFSCLDSCRSELRSRSLASTVPPVVLGDVAGMAVSDGGDRTARQIYRRTSRSPHGRRARTSRLPPTWSGRLAAMRQETTEGMRPGPDLEGLGEALGAASTVLRANAAAAGLDAVVPACPGWTVRE